MSIHIHDALSLDGKVCLVSGGCQNLGAEMVAGFLEAGATVIVTSREQHKAQEMASSLSGDGRVYGYAMDLLSEPSIVGLFEYIKREFGRLDVLVNNAGGHSPEATGRLETETLAGCRAYIDTNVTGTFLMTREYAKLMIPHGEGCVINIASIAAELGRDVRIYGDEMTAQPVQYAAAKAGMLGMTYAAAGYLGPKGIRVNAISPGGFERRQPQAFIDAYADRTMLGHMGREGKDLKGAVVFLASPAAGYITGQNLVVDGGFCRFK